MNKKETMYATVMVKPSATTGSLPLTRHILRPRARDLIVETDQVPGFHRLYDFRVSGGVFEGMQNPPRNARFLSKLLDQSYGGGSRSKFTHRHVIISIKDPVDYRLAKERLYGLVDAFKAKLCTSEITQKQIPVIEGYHEDKAHCHVHLEICNWMDGAPLQWKRNDIIYMNSLRWDKKTEVEAGANLYKRDKLERRPVVYAKADTSIKELVELIKDDPEYKLADMVAKGKLHKYTTATGNPGYIFQGKKITLAKINYELKAQKGVILDKDGHEVESPTVLRTELERQHHIDKQMGVEDIETYEKYQDTPQVVLTPRQAYEMEQGVMPWDRGFRRQARTAFVKRQKYGKFGNGLDPGLKPLVSLIETMVEGLGTPAYTPPKGSVGRFLLVVASWIFNVPLSHFVDIPAIGGMDMV